MNQSQYPESPKRSEILDDSFEPPVESFADPLTIEPERIPVSQDEPFQIRQEDVGYRGAASDPFFGFLLAIALSVGLIPLIPDNIDLRYTVAWGALAMVGVLAWLLGNAERIGQEKPENIAFGVGFGILLGAPFLLFGAPVLTQSARLFFVGLTAGTVLAYLIFVMPLAESLFFRGVMQSNLDFWLVGLLGGLWNVILFFPVMWDNVLTFPLVAAVIVVALLMMNMMYAYIRERNGLAAAWLCQITVNLLMVFIPFIS